MKGKLIPNEDLKNLNSGTKLLTYCFDEDFWLVCTLEKDEGIIYLKDIETNSSLTDVDNIDEIDKFLKVYEYYAEDADEHIKRHIPSNNEIIDQLTIPQVEVLDSENIKERLLKDLEEAEQKA